MAFGTSSPTATKKARTNKFVLGFAALAATAVVGTTGIAAAQTQNKPSKEQCAAAGYSNYGQCVREWAQNKNNPGGGYGGNNGNTANVNLDLDVSGDGNVISIILNLFR